MTQAACAPGPGADPEQIRALHGMFFADHPSDEVGAKKMCFSCPVMFDCLRNSLSSDQGGPERYGVFGGHSQKERFSLHKMLNENGLTL